MLLKEIVVTQRKVGILFKAFKSVKYESHLIFKNKVYNKIIVLTIFSIA